jgi:hypothetical protein
MTPQPIRLDLDLSALPEDALRFVEAIASECRYQAPPFLGALARMLEQERASREAGTPGLVLFTMPDPSIVEMEQAARAALVHAALCADCARMQADRSAGDAWVAMSRMFLAIHNGVVAAVGLDALLSYRLSQLSPPSAALN